MKYIFRLLTGLLFVAAMDVPASFAQTTHYISASLGNDVWSGLLPEPNAEHTDGPKQSVNAAREIAANLAPGDKLFFRRGDNWDGITGILSLSSTAGAPDNYIIVGAYGSGSKPRFDVTGTGNALFFRGSNSEPTSYIRIEDLHIMTTGIPGDRPTGIYVIETYRSNDPHHIIFDGIIVEGLKFGAVIYETDITVTNCVFRNNYGISPESGHTQGIYASGMRMVFTSNIFSDNGKPGVGFDHNTYLSGCVDCVYSDNTVSGGFSGLKVRRGSGMTIAGNTMSNLEYSTITVGADDGHTLSDTVIDSNTLFDTGRGINVKAQSSGTSYIDNLTIKNNIIYNTTSAGITLHNTHIVNSGFYNNLVYDNGARSSISVSSSALLDNTLSIKNNILVNPDTQTGTLLSIENPTLDGLDIDHNLYYGQSAYIARVGGVGFGSLSAFGDAFPGVGTHAIAQDPQLSNPPDDFSPSSESAPSIDRGISLVGVVDNDFAGNTRPFIIHPSSAYTWDVGPYEYRGNGSPSRPGVPGDLRIQK